MDARKWMTEWPEGWQSALKPLAGQPFMSKLVGYLASEQKSKKTIYPEPKNIFRALREVDLPEVKVVILGQDPYHGPGQAIGLSFAVPNQLMPKPPSLRNIFKELADDLKVEIPKGESDLSGWVSQGVLLLNTVLTVEAEKPLSHRDRGWEQFTDAVIRVLNDRERPLVFVLWGSHAQKFKQQLDSKRHTIIEAPHPSPLSAYRGFFGSKPFSKVNEALKAQKNPPIQWQKVSI